MVNQPGREGGREGKREGLCCCVGLCLHDICLANIVSGFYVATWTALLDPVGLLMSVLPLYTSFIRICFHSFVL